MRQALLDLFGSKKFLVGMSSSITALLVRVSARFGIGIDDALATQLAEIIVFLATVWLLAQGASDHGKEAAAVNAAATVTTAATAHLTAVEQAKVAGTPPIP